MPSSNHPNALTNHHQVYQSYLDASTPYTPHRWGLTIIFTTCFFVRILVAQGWYIVAYCLGIYILNLFLAFLQPKFDPSMDSTEDEGLEGGQSSLPTKADEEFRPFIRRLPEFKFWHSATRAIVIGLFCSFFEIFNLPVFWPVLVMYWLILFALTSECKTCSAMMEECADMVAVRRQIQHMIKYRYVPFSIGKAKYSAK